MSAYTQADLETLERALLQNQTSVSLSGGRNVTFADADDLLKRIEYVRRQLAEDQSRQLLLAEFSKGVQC